MVNDMDYKSTSFFNIEPSNEGNITGNFKLPLNALSARYCSWLGSQGKHRENSHAKNSKPFLSIVTRTQGKRIEELSEVFLCLTSQECMDFEILLVGHNLNNTQQEQIDKLVKSFPEEITSKIKYLLVEGGTRTTPLNTAFTQATGHYIAILDDDDIVLDNWVENFHELAESNYGKILFSFPIRQDWESSKDNGDLHRLRASGILDPCYCHDYNYIDQLTSNECPPCSLAFPAYVFQELGVNFDESLTTTEDWDFLMRASFVCDIATHTKPSSIYRIWKNAESSRSVHTEEEWKDNYEKILSKLDSTPLLFPEGMVQRLTKRSNRANYSPQFTLNHSFLVANQPDPRSDSETKITPQLSNKSGYSIMFKIPQKISSRDFELHLFDMNCFTLRGFDALLENNNKDEFLISMNEFKHSGFQVDSGHIIFLEKEPIIKIRAPRKMLPETLHVRLLIEDKIEEVHARQLAKGSLALWIGRLYRWIKRKLRGNQPADQT